MELGERKKQVLRTVIETYIRTGEPIGSKAIVEHLDNAVSSATIRNDMAELSAYGLLEQPHTSAGRVPTVAAFRLYIDRLMPHRKLDEHSRREIDGMLESCSRDPEKLVDMASRALAEETHCAAVTTTPWEQGATVQRIEFMAMSSQVAAVILMTGSGIVRSRVARFDRSLPLAALSRLAEELRRRFIGVQLTEIGIIEAQNTMAAMGEYGLRCAPLITAFVELAAEAARFELLLAGQMNLLQRSDLPQESARGILQFLTQREQLMHMLSAHSGGLRVVLGEESPRPELSGSGIIVTRYQGGHSTGSIGVIGPLRMDYAQLIPRVEYFAGALGRVLTELMEE
ncbi:MAG: heat-inducible transcription repressor HrcA [Clostridia bacterium]|nr:heat-inducible transcription repressor HrcA [Clostridia bacterium]